jgi:hypothetical protein
LSGKLDVCADNGPNHKKKRKALHHLEKLKVVDKLDIGTSIAVVICNYGVNKSTTKTRCGEALRSMLPTREKFLVYFK